jgi:hypothetical protein
MKTTLFNIRVGLIFLSLLLCLPLTTFALEVGEQEVAVTITESYASRFISQGQDCYPENYPIWETCLDIEFPGLLYDSDLSFSLWWGYPLKAGNVTGEELDYSVAISRDLKDILNISAGYTYFDFPKANKDSDSNEFWGSLTLTKLPFLPISVSFTLYAAYEFRASVKGPEDGWYYTWGFGTELDLPDWKIFREDQNLCLDVTNWGTDGIVGLKSSSLYATECSASTSYSFAGFTITPSFNYVFSHEDAINNEDEIWGRIDVSYTF